MSSRRAAGAPMFSAVSSSTRQLFQLLRCIGFASKAQVEISERGIRFTVEESRIMQGNTQLNKELFTTYTYNKRPANRASQDEPDDPVFQISLSALLEALQIFGINDAKDRWASNDPSFGTVTNSLARGGPAAVFDNRVLGMTGVCRLSYAGAGEPFCITLEETGVTTTCELVTYEPESQVDIPLSKQSLVRFVVMRGTAFFDAVAELSSTNPDRLMITTSPDTPFFKLSSSGPLGSASIEFTKDPEVVEQFSASAKTMDAYKYSLIRSAGRAMSLAKKTSIRADENGVMSLQFMIELEGMSGPSFVDFRYAALILDEDEDGDQDGGDDGDESGEETAEE
ncbi:ssDNA endodeoxyribonuclease [Agyrium rufum]|nr:ssDNA endodeoxyribonuclease [Agyrium rufum]